MTFAKIARRLARLGQIHRRHVLTALLTAGELMANARQKPLKLHPCAASETWWPRLQIPSST